MALNSNTLCAQILLLAVPESIRVSVDEALSPSALSSSISGAISAPRVSLWSHTHDKIHANVVVKVEAEADSQLIAQEVFYLLVLELEGVIDDANLWNQSSEIPFILAQISSVL